MLHAFVPAPAGLLLTVEPGLPDAIDAAAEAASPSHAFLRRAWYAGAGGAAVRTLVARRADRTMIAALPTARAGAIWLPIRTVPGSYWPFRSVPIAHDASDAELVALLGDRRSRGVLGRAWRLGPVNEDDAAAARLVALGPQAGWSVLRRRIATDFLFDMAAAWRGGGWPRSSTLKKNRWHEKHLADHGPLEWRYVSGDGWTPVIFDDLATIEARAWVGLRDDAARKFVDPKQRRIWETAVADPALAAMLGTGLLYIAGEPVAFSFGIEAGPVRYCIATSYDERFARHSPGKLLTYRTWFEAAERGITLFDDGAGDGGHKSIMGSAPGPEMMDYLFVRGRLAATVLRRLWR